jgi:hypothetical protein
MFTRAILVANCLLYSLFCLLKSAMLKELPSSQRQGEPKRRWFQSDALDLIVWLTEGEGIWGFQLCYDRGREERVLTWTAEAGYSHDRIDDGEGNPIKNQTPILIPDGTFPGRRVLDELVSETRGIDPRIRAFVVERVGGFAGQGEA